MSSAPGGRACVVAEYRYHTVKHILVQDLDQQPLPDLTPALASTAIRPRHARPWTDFFPDPHP